MIEFFVKRPVTTIMFVLLFVVLGAVSFFNLNVEREPRIDFPVVTIAIPFPGATPLEVETLVIDKVEEAVSELSEIKNIKSFSYDSLGFVIIEFLIKADVNSKSIEVKDKVEAIINDLPNDIRNPIIEKFDPLIEPVLDLVLTSDTLDGRDLYEFADKKLKDRFSTIEGVANVGVYGGKIRQINVILDPMLMRQHYISISDVVRKIQLKNKNIPGGLLEKEKSSLSVRFVGEFDSVDEIADMIFTSDDGVSFPLKDIAIVEDSFKEVETIARFNGQNAIKISIEKVSDGNAINISRDVNKRLPKLREMLPEGVNLEIANDNATFIVNETISTEINILIGIILTIIILYLFTGRVNITFISAIVIPASVVSTLFLMDLSNFTINMMTLLAVATSLGTLIANAIVIIENVLAHLEHKETSIHAAIDGTKEVTGAILASAGTNLVVFTPIAFMGGIVGQFMKSFGLTVVYATLFSLMASFSLTPMLCGLLMKKRNGGSERKIKFFNPFAFLSILTNRLVEFLKKEYKILFDLIFKFPKTTVIIVILMFWSLRFILPYTGSDFYPSTDEDKIKVFINVPQGSTINKTLGVVKEIEGQLDVVEEAESYLSFLGHNGVENALIIVNLTHSRVRERSAKDIIDSLIPVTSKIPDAEINFSYAVTGGALDEGDITINLYGLDYQKMIELSKLMKEKMEESGYFRSVMSSYKTPRQEIKFIPNQEKLINYGIDNVDIGEILRSSIYGNDSNVFKEKGEEYDINVVLNERYTESLEDIKEINIITKKGLVPITQLGVLKKGKAVPTIRHRDKNRIIAFEGYLSKSTTGYVRRVLDKEFSKLPFEEGYGYKYVGMAEYQDESNEETIKSFILAVLLAYMLLCAIMNSTIYPIPIILSIATSFIGVFLLLFFLEESINVASMLGMIMLVGLVVNNSILLLEHAMVRLKEGKPIIEALWLGASEKFRAILMTSIAIVLGVLPQLWAIMPLKTSMGTVMIGGMLASIFFTFVFTPVAFWYIYRLRGVFVKNHE